MAGQLALDKLQKQVRRTGVRSLHRSVETTWWICRDQGGSRLLEGRVSSCPFREDTLLTKPFWLMRNFVQDTSCHLLAHRKTRPRSDKEKASNTASLVPSPLHHSSWRPKRDALGEQ